MTVQLTDKFIAFVDILGFKSLMELAATESSLTHDQLFTSTKLLGTQKDRADRRNGSKICPYAPVIRRDLDFYLTQLSDSIVVSAEVSPAGVINVVQHCWVACLMLLTKGLMCRGYITRGLIDHTEDHVYGPGQVVAIEREKQISIFKAGAEESGTPFIEVDKAIVEYIGNQPDACVKQMFSRFTTTNGELTAIFPIKRLSHSFIVSGLTAPPLDPQKEKRNNDVMRQNVRNLREKVLSFIDTANPSAVRKGEHYVRALNEQLEACDKTDAFIDALSEPLFRRR